MSRPESIFHLVALFDADAPALNLLFYTVRDALAELPRLHDYAAVAIYEHHPEHGSRTVLDYAPFSGLMDARQYVHPNARWRSGYPADMVRGWLAQYPRPISPGWKE